MARDSQPEIERLQRFIGDKSDEIKIALQIKSLMHEYALSVRKISDICYPSIKDRSDADEKVRSSLKLLSLRPRIQDLVSTNKLGKVAALELVDVEAEDVQDRILEGARKRHGGEYHNEDVRKRVDDVKRSSGKVKGRDIQQLKRTLAEFAVNYRNQRAQRVAKALLDYLKGSITEAQLKTVFESRGR